MSETAGFLRLSPVQTVFLAGLGKNAAPGRIGASITLQGAVDSARLKQALLTVVREHEALCSDYRRVAGIDGLLLDVREPGDDVLQWHEGAGSLDSLLATDPDQAVILAQLQDLGTTSQVLHLALPALSADQGSFQRITGALARAYAGQAVSDEDEGLAYSQFSEWLHDMQDDESVEDARAFWHKQTQGVKTQNLPPFLYAKSGASPFSTSMPPTNTLRQCRLCLSGEDSTALRQLAKDLGAGEEPLLLTIWTNLISRHCGDSENETENINLCWLHDCRNDYDEMTAGIGLFARPLPLTVSITGKDTLQHTLSQLDEQYQRLLDWQEFAPEIPPTSEYGHFRELAFEYVERPTCTSTADIRFTLIDVRGQSQGFALQLTCVRFDSTLELVLSYWDGQLNPAAAGRLLEQYHCLLRHALHSPQTPLASLTVLSEQEISWRQALHTSAPSPKVGSFTKQIAANARSHADSPALVDAGRHWTYGELEQQSNQLAHYLIGQGVGAGRKVGICLERNGAYIVAILAVLKTGACFIPLEPQQPPGRLGAILRETGALLITANNLVDGEALGLTADRILLLDEVVTEVAKLAGSAPTVSLSPTHDAYMIYTSGSTGQPKGVVIQHAQLNNYIAAAIEALDLGEGEQQWHYALTSTLMADLGNTVLFPSLATGACLHILDAQSCISATAIQQYLASHAIDCMKIVPSHLDALLDGGDVACVLPGRRLILGGESCPPELLRRVVGAREGLRVFNHYGPTETTIGVMYKEITEAPSENVPTTLAHALPGNRIYVLDRNRPDNQPGLATTGVVGEVYIGGAQVSPGYFQRDDLTARHMLPDPFSTHDDSRCYRTGDLARVNADGELIILGRADHQLKVRGYRIEAGEIEALLVAHDSIRRALVLAIKEQTIERLVAYVVPREEGVTLDTPALQSYLRHHLADYMIPSQFLALPALPLLPNGKVDRQRLPKLQSVQVPMVDPRNSVEELLLKLWWEMLNTEEMGVEHNFFELGGHSLLAIKTSARLCRLFQIELPPGILFEHPTVAAMSDYLCSTESQPGKIEATARIRLKLQSMTPGQKAQLQMHQADSVQQNPGKEAKGIGPVKKEETV